MFKQITLMFRTVWHQCFGSDDEDDENAKEIAEKYTLVPFGRAGKLICECVAILPLPFPGAIITKHHYNSNIPILFDASTAVLPPSTHINNDVFHNGELRRSWTKHADEIKLVGANMITKYGECFCLNTLLFQSSRTTARCVAILFTYQ
jgi:hypothetical protein